MGIAWSHTNLHPLAFYTQTFTSHAGSDKLRPQRKAAGLHGRPAACLRLVERSSTAGRVHRAALLSIVEPVLLNQIITIAPFHVCTRAVRRHVSRAELSGALVRVFETIAVKPAAARRVSHDSSQQMRDRGSHRISAEVSIGGRQTATVTRDELRRGNCWTTNGIANEAIPEL